MDNKNLLLGNGINMHFHIEELNPINISKRFRNILLYSSPLYESLFHVAFTPEICETLIPNTSVLGIESLAEKVYRYIYNHMNNPTLINNEYRLLNAIKVSAINAIFYEDTQFIKIPTFKVGEVNRLYFYKNIFTLNYTELWKPQNPCTYLHGEYTTVSSSNNGKQILLYASEQYNLPAYEQAVKNLSLKFDMVEFNGYDIIFSPLLDKQKVVGAGHYPAENLQLDDDLFPYDPPKLYAALDGISSLDVFGVSPLGDEKLISHLALIPDLNIYVYGMDKNQVSEWNKKLGRNCCKDSDYFWNES